MLERSVLFKSFAESIVAILNRMIPLHSITLFCDSPDFGSCLFFVSGQQRLYPCYFLRFQLIGRYQIFVIFIQLLFIYFRIARFDFYSFFHPLELFLFIFLVFLGLLRPYLVLESHLVFFWIYLWFFWIFSFIICVWICFRYCLVSRIRIWFWSYIWFFSRVISGFDLLSGSG